MKSISVRHMQANPQEPILSENFSIRDVSKLLAGKDMIQELHRHDFFYLLAIEKGKGGHTIDFHSYKIAGRNVYFMRPGQVHELILKAPAKGYLVQFKSDYFFRHGKDVNQLLRKAASVNLYRLNANVFKKVVALLKYCYEEYNGKQENYHEVIKGNIINLFVELIRQSSNSFLSTATPYSQQRLEEFLELLSTSIAKHKKISQYASMLHMTPYQLNAITKATLGKAGSILINEHIVLESKRYLLATSNQVNQIADILGYEDVSYFIRFFKKQTGYTPDSFRQNFR